MDRLADGGWQGRPTLVTGASGLVGVWLVRALLDAGAPVVSLVRDWVPESGLVRTGLAERVTLVRGDIRDGRTLERLLGEHGIDTVFHLAAQTIVSVGNRNPVETLEVNVAGTWSLLEACRSAPSVRAVVLASSDKAYGAQPHLPYTEDMPLAGRHPYDVSKSCADLLGQAYAASFDAPVAITRCGNIYGGEDLNWSRIVPGTIRSLLAGERPVIRSDGLFVRDYLYVEDAIGAYFSVAERLRDDPALRGEAFNFATGAPVSVLELVRMLVAAVGEPLEPEIRNEVSNEIREQYLDAGKAERVLGWTPFFPLAEGLERTVEWYRGFLQPSPGDAAPATRSSSISE